MPTYEYKCPQCDIRFSTNRGVNDPDPGYSCKDCKISMSRVFAVGGISFKGSGFYRTDK